jgi:hypothetical protein
MKSAFLAAASLFALPLAAPAAAQTTAAADLKVNQLIVYGNDPCPQSTETEITVCARRSEGDRYRIPEALRDRGGPASNSWANRALELQYVGRSGVGSCSTSGPGGMIGCFNQIMDQARAERQDERAEDWNALIEKARQERLGRIDEQSEEIERDLTKPR